MAPTYERIEPSHIRLTMGLMMRTVETNNFRQVLKNYDARGRILRAETTHVGIECQICQDKNLALVNWASQHVFTGSYENYSVLPRCGHAFGHECLEKWIRIQGKTPSCPTCRTPVYCDEGHVVPLEVYGYTGKTLVNTEERSANELNHIRATIENPTCKRCIIIQQAQSPESHPVYIPYPGHIARRRTPSTITGEYNWYHSRNEEGMYRYGSDQTPASEDEYPEPMEIYGSNLAPVLWFGINLYLAAREDDERREPLRRNTDRENVVNVGQHGPRPL